MPAGRHAVVLARASLAAVLALVALMIASSPSVDPGHAMQEATDEPPAHVRIIHGIADAGPLDVYVDGSLALIGIVFAETSADIRLPGGERAFAVVPSGSPLEEAIASGTIALRERTRYYIALLGTSDGASVGRFTIDERPLAAGQARFRVINGVPDAGEIVPAFTGGEALSQPLAFGDASEYAAIDAGSYDLDLLDAASGGVLLSLPQTPFADGATTDVVVIGQLADGSMQALVEPFTVEVERAMGRSARIVAGTCADPGDVVADLGVVQEAQGEVVGTVETAPVAQGFGLAAVPFTSLIGAPHAVAVGENGAGAGNVVACGDIGGRLTDTGALVIALQTGRGQRTAGVAVLAPGLEDPDTTGVSVFLTAGAAPRDGAGTPTAQISG